MGLLDSLLYNSDNYGGQGGGLLDFLRSTQMQQNNYQPNSGFDAAPATFADRFNAIPGAPQPVQPSSRQFDTATFDPATYAPNQAAPIAVGGYQMPRIGNADQFVPQQAMTPPNAQPAQGQVPPIQQPAQQPQDALPPAFGGGGYLERLQNGGSLIGSLFQSSTPQQQNLTAQYSALRQALLANGENPQAAASKAMVAVMNPEAAKTIIPELFTNREKWQKIGIDPTTGQELYGFVNERDQTINGKPASAVPTSANSTMGDPSLTGDAYLQSLPESIRSQVKAVVEGRMQPPSGFALKSPQIQALMRAAAQYEPGFDLTKWGARAATAKDFASGQAAKNVTSLNTVVGHLGDLKEKADALDNGGIPIFNQIGNAYNTATGGAKVNNFNIARNAVADELAKVFKGSGISDHEIAQWKETLNAAQSPEQLKGAIKTAIGLMDSRLSALNDQRDRGMNTSSEPRSLLNEKSQKSLKAVEDWASGDDTKKEAKPSVSEGATATNPQTGQKIVFKGGKWVPAQ
jgi:hypothetical protein